METCFVIQPFDGDVYDKRYNDVFAPAINNANLEPYRVDRDPGVSIPIDDIEKGICKARMCFAEITTDNPNVWFELGYAIAASKVVVLVCSEDRKSKFPFDVQHRSVIKYRCGAPQDFQELQNKITERLDALQKKETEIARAKTISPIKDSEGLTQHEIVALVTVVQNEFVTGELVSAYTVKSDMNNAGFTDIATALAVRALEEKRMLLSQIIDPLEGGSYTAISSTRQGQDWLMGNQHLLKLKDEPAIPF
jgi:hypothetical protein